MSKREDLEGVLREFYYTKQDDYGIVDVSGYADKVLEALGLELVTTEKVVVL